MTTSVVTLAADLWRTSPDWAAHDLYPLLTHILDSLSSRGLVRFKVYGTGAGYAMTGLAYEIRLTPDGWSLMGYAHQSVEVGTMGRHSREPNPGDQLDYLNYDSHAIGGPIEVEDFATHRGHYPTHTHMYGDDMPKRTAMQFMAEERTLATTESDGKRGYTRITADIEAMILAAKTRLGTLASYADVAEETGLSANTVKYVLGELPRLRRGKYGDAKMQASLKERVLALVIAFDSFNGRPIRDVAELRMVLGVTDDEHSLMHVLHSLHTAGQIDFDERGNGMGTASAVRIRMPKRSRKGSSSLPPEDVQEIEPEKLAEPEATAEPTPTDPVSAPKLDPEDYPLLDRLLEREGKRIDSDAKGMAYVAAAEAIQHVDPEAASLLMEKSKQYDVEFPSPIEREYLRYVAHHPIPQEDS